MNFLSSISSPSDLKKLNLKELMLLADDIRTTILHSVANTGGHLASNLGVVELTLALHTVFHSPKDKIIWDVGHQCYTHKLLTGRYDAFKTLRQYGGMSGFPKRYESEHDIFEVGHSSTSLSAALGMAISRDLQGESHHIIAVIGDGALTGGMAFEALNQIGHLQKKVIIILNDNQMSISPNVGAISHYLNRIRTAPQYEKVKQDIELILKRIPGVGKSLAGSVQRLKNSLKYLMVSGMFFEEMELTYLGPIDGHNIPALQNALQQAKQAMGPVIVHCKTEKGHGYALAEQHPDKFHGVGPFDLKTGHAIKARKRPTYTQIFSETIVEMAEVDDRLVAITAAMKSGVGLTAFEKRFPKRFFDVGIAEQHAVTMAAGLAVAGLRPIVALYSTFLQRAYDQIVHDVCMQNLPVVFAIDRAGLVGQDGATHHGVFDLSFLQPIPNMTIMAPKDAPEMQAMLKMAISLDTPVAVRYPRGAVCQNIGDRHCTPLEVGKAEVLREGHDVVIWAIGNMVSVAEACAEQCAVANISATVINSRFLKPFDDALLSTLAGKIPLFVTLEDHSVQGGLGSVIGQLLSEKEDSPVVLSFGIPDTFVDHGAVSELYHEIGLEVDAIVPKIMAWFKAKEANDAFAVR